MSIDSFRVEQLESRSLLSAVTLVGGTLEIEGTGRADRIDVKLGTNTGELVVTRNQQVTSFPLSAVSRIEIDAFNGNDLITVDEAITLPTDIDAGRGNDTVFGGSGPDDIDGGSGNDRLLGRGGDDNVDGEAGNDFVSGGEGNDTVSGGSGRDVVFGDAGADLFDDDDRRSELRDFLAGTDSREL